jgi:hypothetical protein
MWGDLQPIISGVLAVVSIVSAALVGVLVGTQKTLRDTVADRGVRIEDLEKEQARKDSEHAKELAARESELTEANSENRILKSMVTNKVEIVALTDLMDEHHRQATHTWASIDGHIEQIPTRIAAVLREHKDENP